MLPITTRAHPRVGARRIFLRAYGVDVRDPRHCAPLMSDDWSSSDDARGNPWRCVYDTRGRSTSSPSRAVENARKVAIDTASARAPYALVVELERARGLRAARKPTVRTIDAPKHVRAYVQIELARGDDDEDDEYGRDSAISVHAEEHRQFLARRFEERQRAATASSKHRTAAPEFQTKFLFYASRVLDDDVLRIVVFGERGAFKAQDELGVVNVPTRALGTKSDADFDNRAFWVPINHRERKAEHLGTFTYHAYFDHETKGTLRVKVTSARGIKASDMNGLSDPYVKVRLRRGLHGTLEDIEPQYGNDALGSDVFTKAPKIIDTRRTATVAKTLAPEWNEEFEFIKVNRSSDAYLIFELWDHDIVGDDDMLGVFAFYVKDLKAARAGDPHAAAREVAWRAPLNKLTPLGTCNVVAYFEDDERRHLCVKVSKARDICAADIFGTANAFVVVTCGTEMYQTASKPNTLAPRWDHVMRFSVTTPPPSPEALEEGCALSAGQEVKFELYHRADDGRALFLGQTQISLHAVQTASAGGDKQSRWLPFVERDVVVNLGEIRMRAYFESNNPAERPRVLMDDKGRVIDALAERRRQAYDAMEARIERELAERVAVKARQSSAHDVEIHAKLVETIASKLRTFQWPEDLVPSYAKAYAACANAPELLPPPPADCKLPQDIARMFEAAAFSRVEKPHKK